MIDTEGRALQSAGASDESIYAMVACAIQERGAQGGVVIDVGCGNGNLWPFLRDLFERYIGVDVVRYPDLPSAVEFHRVDLDTGHADLPDGCGDVVVAAETIEHIENPRAFVRELARLTRPSGWVFLTTPNQLSLLSKLTFVFKNQFNAFQDAPGLYPAHITALLETDLIRIARESGLGQVEVAFSRCGRVPAAPIRYPRALSQRFPRLFSDNVLLAAQKSAR